MKFDKPKEGNHLGPNDKYDDGTTPAQRANMKAVRENSEAYAEWRIRVGMAKEPEPPINFRMRDRIASEFRKMGVALAAIPDDRKFGPRRSPYVLPDKSV